MEEAPSEQASNSGNNGQTKPKRTAQFYKDRKQTRKLAKIAAGLWVEKKPVKKSATKSNFQPNNAKSEITGKLKSESSMRAFGNKSKRYHEKRRPYDTSTRTRFSDEKRFRSDSNSKSGLRTSDLPDDVPDSYRFREKSSFSVQDESSFPGKDRRFFRSRDGLHFRSRSECQLIGNDAGFPRPGEATLLNHNVVAFNSREKPSYFNRKGELFANEEQTFFPQEENFSKKYYGDSFSYDEKQSLPPRRNWEAPYSHSVPGLSSNSHEWESSFHKDNSERSHSPPIRPFYLSAETVNNRVGTLSSVEIDSDCRRSSLSSNKNDPWYCKPIEDTTREYAMKANIEKTGDRSPLPVPPPLFMPNVIPAPTMPGVMRLQNENSARGGPPLDPFWPILYPPNPCLPLGVSNSMAFPHSDSLGRVIPTDLTFNQAEPQDMEISSPTYSEPEIASSTAKAKLLPTELGSRLTSQSIKIIVAHVSFPAVYLTEEQIELTKKLLFDAILVKSDDNVRPAFNGCEATRGCITFCCANEDTVRWLKRVVLLIRPWKDGYLKTIDASTFEKLNVVVVDILDKVLSDKEILKALKAQNADLNTDLWRVISRQSSKTGVLLTMTIDLKSLEALKKTEFSAFFKYSCVKIKLSDYVN